MRHKYILNKGIKASSSRGKSERKWDKLLTETLQLDIVKADLTTYLGKHFYLPLGQKTEGVKLATKIIFSTHSESVSNRQWRVQL